MNRIDTLTSSINSQIADGGPFVKWAVTGIRAASTAVETDTYIRHCNSHLTITAAGDPRLGTSSRAAHPRPSACGQGCPSAPGLGYKISRAILDAVGAHDAKPRRRADARGGAARSPRTAGPGIARLEPIPRSAQPCPAGPWSRRDGGTRSAVGPVRIAAARSRIAQRGSPALLVPHVQLGERTSATGPKSVLPLRSAWLWAPTRRRRPSVARASLKRREAVGFPCKTVGRWA